MDSEFRKNFGQIVANLNSTTGSIDEIIGSKETELKTALNNLAKFSDVLSSEAMEKTIANFESISDTLAAADIFGAVANLKASLENTSALLVNLTEGKGSAGKLFSNDSLYTNLTATLGSLNMLLADMKENPKRYVHFSLFGKKNIPAD
jgi:phospholipid/cholesterol/gamma-HCH transport system substrate-binding protein